MELLNPLYIGIGVLVVIALWVVATYNSFATMRVRIKASIQEIGNQLKRQADLIPNIESSAKGYLKHEKDVFKMLTDARRAVDTAQKSSNIKDIEKASDFISQFASRLQILVESNPQLQGAEVVTKLMDELRDTSDKLMFSRRVYIDLTADYNTKRVVFPTSIIASMFGFTEEAGLGVPDNRDFITVSDTETKSPKVDL